MDYRRSSTTCSASQTLINVQSKVVFRSDTAVDIGSAVEGNSLGSSDAGERLSKLSTPASTAEFSVIEGRKIDFKAKPSDTPISKRTPRLHFPPAGKTFIKGLYSDCKEYKCNNMELTIQRKALLERTNINTAKTANADKKISSVENATRRNSVLSSESKTSSYSTKKEERAAIQLPKVESYNILTPRTIINSNVCYVFKQSGRWVEASRAQRLKGSQDCFWKNSVFSKISQKQHRMEWRHPSPVKGIKLSPREQERALEDALQAVAECNNVPCTPPPSEVHIPVKKFVIRLPPIC